MVIFGDVRSVVNVGDVSRTTDPEPVEVVVPVPPLRTGRAVPESVMANVPEVVIGEPDVVRNEGVVIATEVTVPVPGNAPVDHVIGDAPPPPEVKYCPIVIFVLFTSCSCGCW